MSLLLLLLLDGDLSRRCHSFYLYQRGAIATSCSCCSLLSLSACARSTKAVRIRDGVCCWDNQYRYVYKPFLCMETLWGWWYLRCNSSLFKFTALSVAFACRWWVGHQPQKLRECSGCQSCSTHPQHVVLISCVVARSVKPFYNIAIQILQNPPWRVMKNCCLKVPRFESSISKM